MGFVEGGSEQCGTLISPDIFVQVGGGAVTADPKSGGPHHEGGGLRVVKAFEFGFQAGFARSMAGVHHVEVAGIRNPQNKIRAARVLRKKADIFVRFHDGFELARREGRFY